MLPCSSRRTRRRQAREGRGELRHMDGLSSDDELSPKEQAHATSAKKEVMEQAKRWEDTWWRSSFFVNREARYYIAASQICKIILLSVHL